MAQMIDKRPTYKGEAILWDNLSKNLPDNVVVYNQREINGREYDFCLMIENVGIIIIEVKGWDPNKIEVKGVDEIIVEGYDKPQTSPKKQARAYRFAILNKITEKYNVSPLVLDMVCYPYISKEKYYEKHLDIISDETYTLFEEDLSDNTTSFKKIMQVFNSNNAIPHADFSVELMTRIRRALEPGFIISTESNEMLPYSKLYYWDYSEKTYSISQIVDEYFKGVKTQIFINSKDLFNQIIDEINKGFKTSNIENRKNNLAIGYKTGITKNEYLDEIKMFNFEMYYLESFGDVSSSSFIIIEGNTNESQSKLLSSLSNRTSFNYQQYCVEHANPNNNVLVQAGAGTGKTYSMVSRIAFLCNKLENPVNSLANEIAMVTFTNDAANNMKIRLKQMFINYYLLTNKESYLKFVEEIDIAHISTIHKFAINILRNESLYTGLGTNFRITYSEYNRGKAYDLYLSQFLETMEDDNPNFYNELPVPIYDLKKKLMTISDRLFDKSIDFSRIKPSDLGSLVYDSIPYFNDLLINVVFPAETLYYESSKAINEIELKECLIELGKILSTDGYQSDTLELRYMFIDEFQDTDDVQIEIFKLLQKSINNECQLFVVGDLKQSIYRFRGAKMNAFDKLQEAYLENWDEYRLTTNYRTDGRLLDIFDPIFVGMGNRGFLPYTDSDRLTSDVISDGKEDELFVGLPCHGKDQDNILAFLNETIISEMEKIKNIMETKELSREERTIAILVRSNYQIEQIIKAASKKELVIETSNGGDLFQLPSTADLYKLLLAIVNNTNPVYLVNLIESNYIGLKLDYQRLGDCSIEEKTKELTNILNEYFTRNAGISWTSIISEVLTEPVLYVLKKIFDELQPWKIYSRNFEKQKLYISNYEYLLEKIINYSRVDSLTINQIVQYLSINILTNQHELSRAVDNDDDGIHIICTTVHKSKGLEYGTVIIPFTYEDIGDTKKVKTEAYYEEDKLSYTVLFENEIRERNSNYSEQTEANEQIAEESRILYVALTRAIRNVIWINNIDRNPNISWSVLLEE